MKELSHDEVLQVSGGMQWWKGRPSDNVEADIDYVDGGYIGIFDARNTA